MMHSFLFFFNLVLFQITSGMLKFPMPERCPEHLPREDEAILDVCVCVCVYIKYI